MEIRNILTGMNVAVKKKKNKNFWWYLVWAGQWRGGEGCWGNNYYFIINKPFNAPCHKGGKSEDIVRRHSHARVFGWSWSLHNITNKLLLFMVRLVVLLLYFFNALLYIIQRFEDMYVKESKPCKLNLKAIIKWSSFNKSINQVFMSLSVHLLVDLPVSFLEQVIPTKL